MTNIIPDHLKELIETVAAVEDHTKRQEHTDFDFTPPPAGPTVGRLIEYIEFGKQPRRAFKGKDKKPADEVWLTFELTHPKNVKEIELEGGEKKLIADKITVKLTKSLSSKGKFAKLFDKMRYGRENVTNMLHMLNDPFLIEVVHSTVAGKDGAADKTYANITNEAGEFLVSAPYKVDALAGTREMYAVPEAINPFKVFVFKQPTKATWDSLFIDGVRTKTVDGVEKEVSKNYLQQKVMSATDFEGSELQNMLLGANALPEFQEDTDVDNGEVIDDDTVEEEVEAPKPQAGAAATAKQPAASPASATKSPSKPKAAAKTAPVTTTETAAPAAKAAAPSAVDAFAALGLPTV